MNPIKLIDDFILEILTLKGPTLFFAFLIVLGYGMKTVKAFPREYIPRVILLVGVVLSPFLLAWPDTGQQDFHLRWPAVAAWISVLMTGFLLAAGSWLFHNKVLKPYIDDRIGAKRTSQETKLKVVDTDKGIVETSKETKSVEKIVIDETKPPKDSP